MIAESARELARLVRRTRYDFRGKVIVVTGGAGGIGQAFCRVAAARGASVAVVDLTDVAQIEAMLDRSADARVITTISLAGILPQAETPIYCASKFGLRGAMLSIALDLRQRGITVSSVLPSATDTPMLAREAVEGGNSLQFQDPPQTPAHVAAVMMALLDRPRLEAYPKPQESWLVRAAMAVPSLLPAALPFFEGRGQRGEQEYRRRLVARGDAIEVDGRLQLTE